MDSKPTLPSVPKAFDWEAFRENGHKVIDFIADYHKSINARQIPVRSVVEPGYLTKILPQEAPEKPGEWSEVMNFVQQHVVRGMTHWQHPDFFAYFPSMLSPPALLGDLISNSFNQPGFSWVCSPAATELEIVVMEWFTKAFDLPQERFSWKGTGGGVLQSSATEGAIVAMIGAKTRALRHFKEKYNSEPYDTMRKLVCYVSDQAHFCIEKAAKVLSIPHIRKIKSEKDPVTGNVPVSINALKSTIQKDVDDGLYPFFISGNFGATGTCAIDDLKSISEIAEQYQMWYNVDGAYAGVTAIIPEFRARMTGIEKADSILINASKWLCAMFNSSLLFLGDKKDIVSSLNTTGVFLANPLTEAGLVVDFKDYHLGLGRPFRSMKMYSMVATFGIEGLRSVLKRHIMLAKYFAEKVEQEGLLSVVVKPEFGLVCLRLKDGTDEENTKLLDQVNATNKAYLVHTVLEGRVTLRVALASPSLEYDDMDSLAKVFNEQAKKIKEKLN